MMTCGHKCHGERGLNPWIKTCPTCGCPNAKYDAVNGPIEKEKFIVEMERAGFAEFRETVELLEIVHGER
jgi:hypothetical protein